MHEILGRCRYAPGIFGNQAPDSGNAELLAIGGSPEQKERWMHPLLRGELRSSFSMTEPGAGADPTLLSTRAVLDGDEYVINGHKWFSSNASVADFLIVMCVTDPDVSAYQGSSMIIVPVDDAGRRHRPRHPRDGPPDVRAARSTAGTPRCSTATCGCRRRTWSATPATGSGWPSSAWAPAGSTTRCAGSASRSGRSTCCASAR